MSKGGPDFSHPPAPPPPAAARREPASEAERFLRQLGPRDRGLAEGWTYAFCAFAVRICLVVFCAFRVFHHHRVPVRGAAIIASNHASFLDPMVVGSALRRRPCYLARDSLFRVPLLRQLLRALGVLPLPRESAAPREALELSLNVLSKGRMLVVFPEGTRSADGRLGKLRKGVAWIARRSGAPVVPARVEGSFEAWPRHRLWPRCRPMHVFFGEPMIYDKDESVNAFLERLQRRIAELGRREAMNCGAPASSWPETLSCVGSDSVAPVSM